MPLYLNNKALSDYDQLVTMSDNNRLEQAQAQVREVTDVMRVNVDCESGFKCLEVLKKTEDVLSVKIGRLSRNSDEACNQQLFFDRNIPFTIIISK